MRTKSVFGTSGAGSTLPVAKARPETGPVARSIDSVDVTVDVVVGVGVGIDDVEEGGGGVDVVRCVERSRSVVRSVVGSGGGGGGGGEGCGGAGAGSAPSV